MGSGWLRQPLMKWGNWYFPRIWRGQETVGGESWERDLVPRAALQGLVWGACCQGALSVRPGAARRSHFQSDQLFGLPEAWAGAGGGSSSTGTGMGRLPSWTGF